MNRDRGQAAVEFALALPLVAVMVLGIIQIVVIARDQLTIEVAARVGARAASVSAEPERAADSAVSNTIDLDGTEMSVSDHGDTVSVRISYLSPTDVPLIGVVIGDVRLEARVVMPKDPPP